MALISWDTSYSVNIKEIDSQHKKLVAMINTLYDKINEGHKKEAVESVIDELVKYTFYHFSFEESLLAKHSYAELSKHSKFHNEMIEKIKFFMLQLQRGDQDLSDEMLSYLKSWLINHICTEDKKYADYLNAKGVK